MPHHDVSEPGSGRADDSRERPETAVTDDRPPAAHDDPTEPSHSSAIARTITRTGEARRQSPRQDEDDDDKKKKKHRRDPKHTRLTSATNRAADKGDAER